MRAVALGVLFGLVVITGCGSSDEAGPRDRTTPTHSTSKATSSATTHDGTPVGVGTSKTLNGIEVRVGGLTDGKAILSVGSSGAPSTQLTLGTGQEHTVEGRTVRVEAIDEGEDGSATPAPGSSSAQVWVSVSR